MSPDFLPRKKLGQNFLFDQNILKKMVSFIKPEKKDFILEIGAGLGTLTALLAKRAGHVLALEIDKRATSVLTGKFKGQENIKILNQDFLKFDISKIPNGKRLKVVGNIPYYITSDIIQHLLNFKDRIDSIFMTVQKEVAERIVASPSTSQYGSLTCFLQYYTEPKKIFNIKAGSFWPRPKVDSAFIVLRVLQFPKVKVNNEDLFFKLIRLGFNQRRKMFVNAVGAVYEKEMFCVLLRGLGLDPNLRIENLSLADLAMISNRLNSVEGG